MRRFMRKSAVTEFGCWSMAYQPTAISDDLKNLPKLPAWVTTGRVETLETVAFRSGAALMVLDQLVSDPSKGVPLKLLANRLALATATQTSKLEGRLAREADIRDAYHLAPAGDLLAFWHDAARLRLISKDWSADLKECVGSNFKDDVAGLIEAGVSHAKTHGPLAGCVAVRLSNIIAAVLKGAADMGVDVLTQEERA